MTSNGRSRLAVDSLQKHKSFYHWSLRAYTPVTVSLCARLSALKIVQSGPSLWSYRGVDFAQIIMSQALPLVSVIGFGGHVPNGLVVHPDADTVIYPLGSIVVLRSKSDSGKQQFLRGHTHEVVFLGSPRVL